MAVASYAECGGWQHPAKTGMGLPSCRAAVCQSVAVAGMHKLHYGRGSSLVVYIICVFYKTCNVDLLTGFGLYSLCLKQPGSVAIIAR